MSYTPYSKCCLGEAITTAEEITAHEVKATNSYNSRPIATVQLKNAALYLSDCLPQD